MTMESAFAVLDRVQAKIFSPKCTFKWKRIFDISLDALENSNESVRKIIMPVSLKKIEQAVAGIRFVGMKPTFEQFFATVFALPREHPVRDALTHEFADQLAQYLLKCWNYPDLQPIFEASAAFHEHEQIPVGADEGCKGTRLSLEMDLSRYIVSWLIDK